MIHFFWSSYPTKRFSMSNLNFPPSTTLPVAPGPGNQSRLNTHPSQIKHSKCTASSGTGHNWPMDGCSIGSADFHVVPVIFWLCHYTHFSSLSLLIVRYGHNTWWLKFPGNNVLTISLTLQSFILYLVKIGCCYHLIFTYYSSLSSSMLGS